MLTGATSSHLRRFIGTWHHTGRVRRVATSDLADLDLTDVELVSLDVFDTCLGRAVGDATDVFALVGAELAETLTPHTPTGRGVDEWYRSERIAAERRARSITIGPDITMSEIVDQLADAIQDRGAVDAAIDRELDLERRVSVPRHDVRDFARRAVAQGSTLVYLSDMYLDAATIEQLLFTGGFPVADVLVSSETGTTKAHGSSYRSLIERYGVAPRAILHVGDNVRVDGRAARAAGIGAVLVDRALLDLNRVSEPNGSGLALPLGDGVVLGLAANLAPTGGDAVSTARRIGTTALGPTQLAFGHWLLDHLDTDEMVLFAARDMRQQLDLHHRLCERAGRPIRAAYFEASRRSLGLPAIAGGITEADREFLIGGRGLISECALWARIGLQSPDGAAGDEPLPMSSRHTVWRRMLDHEDVIVARAREELDALAEYWANAGLPTAGRVALVDVGWRATVQRSLERCLAHMNAQVEVRGLYLGLLDPPAPGTGPATGWLVDRGEPPRRRVDLESGIPIVELSFQASEGSVISYSSGVAVRGPQPATRDVQDDIQTAAAAMIDRWFDLRVEVAPGRGVTAPLLRLINAPRPDEARTMSGVLHTDQLGDSDVLVPVLPPDLRWRDVLPGPRAARVVRACEWRPGLFAHVGAPVAIRAATTVGLRGLKRLGRLVQRLRGGDRSIQ